MLRLLRCWLGLFLLVFTLSAFAGDGDSSVTTPGSTIELLPEGRGTQTRVLRLKGSGAGDRFKISPRLGWRPGSWSDFLTSGTLRNLPAELGSAPGSPEAVTDPRGKLNLSFLQDKDTGEMTLTLSCGEGEGNSASLMVPSQSDGQVLLADVADAFASGGQRAAEQRRPEIAPLFDVLEKNGLSPDALFGQFVQFRDEGKLRRVLKQYRDDIVNAVAYYKEHGEYLSGVKYPADQYPGFLEVVRAFAESNFDIESIVGQVAGGESITAQVDAAALDQANAQLDAIATKRVADSENSDFLRAILLNRSQSLPLRQAAIRNTHAPLELVFEHLFDPWRPDSLFDVAVENPVLGEKCIAIWLECWGGYADALGEPIVGKLMKHPAFPMETLELLTKSENPSVRLSAFAALTARQNREQVRSSDTSTSATEASGLP